MRQEIGSALKIELISCLSLVRFQHQFEATQIGCYLLVKLFADKTFGHFEEAANFSLTAKSQ